jgi:hypothetical protein
VCVQTICPQKPAPGAFDHAQSREDSDKDDRLFSQE